MFLLSVGAVTFRDFFSSNLFENFFLNLGAFGDVRACHKVHCNVC